MCSVTGITGNERASIGHVLDDEADDEHGMHRTDPLGERIAEAIECVEVFEYGGRVFWVGLLQCKLDDAALLQGVRHFDESADVCPAHIVGFIICPFTFAVFDAPAVDVFHDFLQTLVDFFKRPADAL
ncbi:MAG: hypothetical protein ACJARU_002035 [Congregibacter sp.]